MKKVLSIVLVLAMVIAMTACGSAAPAETNPPAPTPTAPAAPAAPEKPEEKAAEPVELSFFGFKTGAEIGALEELVAEFNEANPDIHVTYEGISNSSGYQDVLTTRLASGQGDDVFMTGAYLPQLAEAGYVKELSGLSTAPNYTDLVIDLMTFDGGLYGLGMEVAVFGMFANMDLLKTVGIEEVPSNYPDFLDACQKVTDAGYYAISCSGKDGTGFGVFAATKGLYPLYQDPNKTEIINKINTGDVPFGDYCEAGFELVKDLMDRGFIDAQKALVMEASKDDIAQFCEGNTAFMPGGAWFIAGIQNGAPDMDFVLTGVPTQDDDALIMINAGVKMSINADTKHPEEAQRFVEFMTSKESMDRYVLSQNSFTPLKNGTSTSNSVVDPVAEFLASGRMISWVDPAFKGPVSVWAIIREYSANIAAGASVAETVEALNTDLGNKIALS